MKRLIALLITFWLGSLIGTASAAPIFEAPGMTSMMGDVSGYQIADKSLEDYGRQEKNFWERLRDWDWDFSDIWASIWDTAKYHIENHGWYGVLAVVIVAFVFFLWFDLTSHAASLSLASGIRSIFTILTIGTVGLAYKSIIFIKDMFIAKTRNTGRMINEITKKDDH